jgi:hypothetical protein
MRKSLVSLTSGVRFDGERPYVEMRARVIRSVNDSLPAGKVMVVRTPIPPPGASDEEIRASTTMEIVDE